MAKPTTEFRTTDIYLSAYLMARGVALKTTEREAAQMTFVFPAGPKINEVLGTWLTGGEVNGLAYATAIKALKAMIGRRPLAVASEPTSHIDVIQKRVGRPE